MSALHRVAEHGWPGSSSSRPLLRVEMTPCNLEFVPSVGVAWNVAPSWAAAIEEDADFGRLQDFLPRRAQAHQIYAVA